MKSVSIDDFRADQYKKETEELTEQVQKLDTDTKDLLQINKVRSMIVDIQDR